MCDIDIDKKAQNQIGNFHMSRIGRNRNEKGQGMIPFDEIGNFRQNKEETRWEGRLPDC